MLPKWGVFTWADESWQNPTWGGFTWADESPGRIVALRKHLLLWTRIRNELNRPNIYFTEIISKIKLSKDEGGKRDKRQSDGDAHTQPGLSSSSTNIANIKSNLTTIHTHNLLT